jgi:hypothetical protein
VDKAALLKRRATDTTDTVPIGDIGNVTVRALSQGEVSEAKESDDYESVLISRALLDPVMTVDEVREWLNTAPAGDAVAVMDKIADLSDLTEGARKSGVAGVRAGRAGRVSTPPRRKAR